jgi:DNA-binding response OmpR family regulator
MRVSRDGRFVDLTPRECAVLAILAREPGRVFTREELLLEQGEAAKSSERAIDAHIKNIRRKIEDSSRRPQHLITVHGVGYRLSLPSGRQRP